MTNAITDNFVTLLEAQAATDQPAWVDELRQDATDSYRALGLPTIRHEEWRFTDIRRIARMAFVLAQPAEVSEAEARAHFVAGLDGPRLVFVNGCFREDLSVTDDLPDGVSFTSLQRAIADETEPVEKYLARYADPHARPFTALNTALLGDGAYLRVPRGAEFRKPVQIVHLSKGPGPMLSSPRNVVVLGENSSLDLIEIYAALDNGKRLVNSVTEIAAGEGARLEHCRLIEEGDDSFHVHWQELRQERDSQVRSHTITLGGAIVRNDINAMLIGQGAHCTLNGLVLAHGSQLVDNHLLVDHARPNCSSAQLYRVVVDDRAHSVFAGKVIVRPGADGTSARQTNNNLLLSDSAQVNTQPQLEIYADDVKCSHGATSGQLDPDSVFFLRARGLDEAQARNLLTLGFAREIIEKVKIPAVRDRLETALAQRFEGLRA